MKTLGKIVTFLGATLFSTSLFAQELPKVNPEDMHWTYFGQHPELNNQPCMTTGYDTDGDGFEDTRFHYMLNPLPNGAMQTRLTGYAIDENGNGYFEDNEWVPYIKKENNGGIDLHEPGNRMDVGY